MLEIDQPVSKELAGMAYWARVVAIAGFALQAILLLQVVKQTMRLMKPKGVFRTSTPTYIAVIGISDTVLLSIVWVINALLILRFSRHMKKALLQGTQVDSVIAFGSLKKSFAICFIGYTIDLVFWAILYAYQWFWPE